MTGWQRPASCDSSACPEVMVGATDVLLRSTTFPDHVACLTLDEWEQLREAMKAGEFTVDQHG